MFSAAGKTAAAVSTAANYIEDVFSTWLYTGNGSTQTITNGIDLSTKGGLVWLKGRSGGDSNVLYDTNRGVTSQISSNSTDAAQNQFPFELTDFNSNGFTIGSGNTVNRNGSTYASWTFREQPKFFDVVTYTGDGTAGRTVAHSLGSVPGCIIVKQTSASGQGWAVYHRSEGQGRALLLNDTAASFLASGYWNSTAPTDTVFTLGSSATVNGSGSTYVAYLFAHDAGGFGLTGTDNVISCGSFTVTSGVNTINLGYEPQWVLLKRSSEGGGGWFMEDTMRGMPVSGDARVLFANTSQAEGAASVSIRPTSTGFSIDSGILSTGDTFIYIAIRRGPMKTPTSGTSVFSPVLQTAATNANVTTNFVVDLSISAEPSRASFPYTMFIDRLRGSTLASTTALLASQSTNAEANFGTSSGIGFDYNTKIVDNLWAGTYAASGNISYLNFRRAPGFFDVVCYTGNGTFGATNHNLGVIPELVIYKKRSGTAQDWGAIYYLSSISYRFGNLNLTDAFVTYSNDPAVAGLFSSTQFCKYYDTSGQTYVAYLFASCPGVSKVGSYTGTGTTLQVNCGFTAGSRFVLIKRTDSTGDWYVWDSARGIVAGNDPYLLLNSTAAEVTNTDYVDTYSAGFEISSTAPAAINANGGSFIFLAIA